MQKIKNKMFKLSLYLSLIFANNLISYGVKNLDKLVANTPLNFYCNSSEENTFFSYNARLRYLNRWAVLHNTEHEDVENHSAETAKIAHALAVIKNVKYGGKIDLGKITSYALYHDVAEVSTGDFPSPVKRYTAKIKEEFEKMEDNISENLLFLISDEKIREAYHDILVPAVEDKEIWAIIKYADNISALTKCLREKRNGNNDFDIAFKRIADIIFAIEAPEVKYFIFTFMPAFGLELPKNYKIN